ncbi:hypothetical protein Pcinc_019376 [Petrolisthes cinctipes]|uniref:Uncharacterized protein n=1 Tax=Petrolisthes cinctipes TaxID=88211 RepID=A0AAE1KHS7_PETCI|nr:hypothetical protein Pcinc_019376 [Petrolisthes cinctipes]
MKRNDEDTERKEQIGARMKEMADKECMTDKTRNNENDRQIAQRTTGMMERQGQIRGGMKRMSDRSKYTDKSNDRQKETDTTRYERIDGQI